MSSAGQPAVVPWRQVVLITLGAGMAFVVLRLLPTGTNLSHMDFRVAAKNSIEFCDPLNPQFIPVVAVRSPVTMTLAPEKTPLAGQETRCVMTLRTANGKPVGPEDLVLAHTRKLHLMIADASLADYQHVHPEPTATRGEWTFAFTPHGRGVYRVFADFTPAATGRGLYASADLEVTGNTAPVTRTTGTPAEHAGYRFTLTPAQPVLRAGETIELLFRVQRPDGAPVVLAPIMGAFAHLVAFDEARSGFAHLHPTVADLAQKLDPLRPTLSFKVTIPRAGRYVIWAQVSLDGREAFVPFWFDVVG